MKKRIAVLTGVLVLLTVFAFAGNSVTKTVAAAPGGSGTWTDVIAPLYKTGSGFLNISVYGATWSATVYLQRAFDGGTTWYDVTTFITNTQKALVDREGGVKYRIGVKSGGFTSGSVAVRLSY